MFYCQDILQRRGGRFAKIWMAATKMSKLSRREIAAVNVEKSCDDILEYIEVRVVPSYGSRRPRFSLYLSALLMNGVVRIHQKHVEYLLQDVSNAFLRAASLTRSLTLHSIDLPEIPRADQVTNPELLDIELCAREDMYLSQLDAAVLMEEPGQFWNTNGTTPVDRSTPVKPKKKKRRMSKDESVPLVADKDTITMKDPPPLVMNSPLNPAPIPTELDLPMMDEFGLSLLMGQVEDQPPQDTNQLPTSTPFGIDTDSTIRQRLRLQQTVLESPIRVIQEDKEKTPERPPQPEVPVEIPELRAVPLSPGVTQQIITSPIPPRDIPRRSLELELTADVPSPRQRKRKRQLAFADAETQIPKNKMRQQMELSKDTCKNFMLIDVQGIGAPDLLSVPGRKELRKEPWLNLWARNACFRRNIPERELAEAISPPQQRSPEHIETRLAEQSLDLPLLHEVDAITLHQATLSPVIPVPSTTDLGRSKRNISTLEESVEELRRISMAGSVTAPEVSVPEISLRESYRDSSAVLAETPRPTINLDDTVLLDESRGSRKGSAKKGRTTRSSLTREDDQQVPPPMMDSTAGISMQTSHTSTGRTLYDVVEEPRFEERLPVPLLHDIPEDLEKIQQELLKSLEEDVRDKTDEVTTFYSLCPPQHVDRKTAAKKFSALLELCSKGSVIATQPLSYEDIYIRMAE